MLLCVVPPTSVLQSKRDSGYLQFRNSIIMSDRAPMGTRQSIENMLTGYSYSRAVMGHILVHLALARTIFSTMSITDNENQAILDMLNDVGALNFLQRLNQPALISIMERSYEKLSELTQNEPAAKMWLQYFHMVSIIKQFIQAKRTRNYIVSRCN